LKKLMPVGVSIDKITFSEENSSITVTYYSGSTIESIQIISEQFSVLAFQRSLVNINAVADKVRVSLPTNDFSRLNAWERSGLASFKTSWLSNINIEPIKVSRAPGQFNQNIYDSNLPMTINNVDGAAVFAPALPTTAQAGATETTDVTFYFSRIAKI